MWTFNGLSNKLKYYINRLTFKGGSFQYSKAKRISSKILPFISIKQLLKCSAISFKD